MTPLQQFSLEATRRYLQSVVFVDDEIFEERTGMAVAAIDDLPKLRKKIYQPEETSSEFKASLVSGAEAEQQEDEVSYRPKDLVSSFAKEGIICALYEPPEDFNVDSDEEIFKLCERPDIIILDWDLSGDAGRKTLNLIAALVKQSEKEFPHHLRLLAIYTIDPSLEGVANQISDRLEKEGLQADPERSSFRIQSGATRILVFGKDRQRIGEEEQFSVKEKDLAVRLISEFAEMNSGILPAYALHGMAAIRRNSKRILERFHGDLNGAFLLHRALSKGSEEAFDQLHELLADELESVLQNQRLPGTTISEITMDAVSQIRTNVPLRVWTYGKASGKPIPSVAYEAILKSLLIDGEIDRNEYKLIWQILDMPAHGFRGIDPMLMQDFLSMVDAGNTKTNERLASLFDSRTQYDESLRELLYGTIIRHRQSMVIGSKWTYSFCLMPICDCVRLDQTDQCKTDKTIEFPFWQLREDVFLASDVTRRGISIRLPFGNYKLLSAGGKARNRLWVHGLKANKTTGTVTARKNHDGRYIFIADEQIEIEWIGQLKSLHSQRIAHDIGQSLSRVGLIEAEWLRLLVDR